LGQYGENIGLAFQIADDVLNVTSSAEALGKAVGSDESRLKATYPGLIGVEASVSMARELIEKATECLRDLPGDVTFLSELAEYALTRAR
jgi:geranylgeranyl pyrophosphate synthase